MLFLLSPLFVYAVIIKLYDDMIINKITLIKLITITTIINITTIIYNTSYFSPLELLLMFIGPFVGILLLILIYRARNICEHHNHE